MSIQTAMSVGSDESLVASHHHPTSPPDRLLTRNIPTPSIHNQESSTTRGRPSDSPVGPLGISNLPSQASQVPGSQRHGQSHSKNSEVSPSISRPGPGYEGTLERKLSTSTASYGHHRKASIVHGIQHSRNPSLATSTATSSPLSPELIAAAGFGTATISFDSPQTTELRSSSSLLNITTAVASHTQSISLSTIKDDVVEVPSPHPTNPMHRKMSSNGKPRREGSHSRSHSKHHGSESKTVGEYALHHLFNSVKKPVSFWRIFGGSYYIRLKA